MKAAVCDDDRIFRETIADWISGYNRDCCKVSMFAGGEALLKSEEAFDVIFLDIDMDGMNGIETARKLRMKDKHVKIIYVTSYSDYVDGAFSVHAFSYILKPITKEMIYKLLGEVLSYTISDREGPELKFWTESGLERLKTDEIYYFEYLSRKIIIHTKKGKYQYRGKISETLNRMKEFGFASPHKSYVVNLFHIKSIKGYEMKMMNGDSIPISQKKSPEFRKLHSRHLSLLSMEADYE